MFGEGLQSSNQPYKYNGKEFDGLLGLNMYDYGARHYDPYSGRWIAVDPLVEKYYSISPYVYVANNPVRFIDPDGMMLDEYIFNQDGDYTGKIRKPGKHTGLFIRNDKQIPLSGETSSEYKIAKYNFIYDNYSSLNYIAVRDENNYNERFAFVSFHSESFAMDSIKIAKLDKTNNVVGYNNLKLEGLKFVFVKHINGMKEVIDEIVVLL